MVNKIILSIALIAFMLIIISGVNDIQSNGAPIASTNAPNELTCNRSPCHTGSTLNSGSGILSMNIDGPTGQYIPGMTYNFTVVMEQSGIERFGFQTLALFDNDSTNAGTFTIMDDARTKVISGINQYEGRKYLTYKYPGTTPISEGIGQWSFKWTAPANNSGVVTFYTAAAAANNDGTDEGDLIYTAKLALQPSGTSIQTDKDAHEIAFTHVFPNPLENDLHIFYDVRKQGSTSIYLTDMISRKSDLLLLRDDEPGNHPFDIDLQQKFVPGLYFLTITNGTSTDVRKLVIR